MDNFFEKSNDSLNTLNDKISILDNKIFKIINVLNEKKYTIKNDETLTNTEKSKLQNEIKFLNEEIKKLLLNKNLLIMNILGQYINCKSLWKKEENLKLMKIK